MDPVKGKQIASDFTRRLGAPKKTPAVMKAWCKPPPDWVKLNIDGSFKSDPFGAGTGMILRDDHGHIIVSSCCTLLHCSEPEEAELCACLEGIALAVQWSQLPILIETDCSSVVRAGTSREADRSCLAALVHEIRALVFGDICFSFVKGDRSQNCASHMLANLVRVEHRTEVWLGYCPPPVVDLVL